MNVVSLNNLWNYLSGLSLTSQNRRWLTERLIEADNKSEASSLSQTIESDEDFISKFFSTPYDNPMTAKEEINMIKNSHYFDPGRKVNHLNYEK